MSLSFLRGRIARSLTKYRKRSTMLALLAATVGVAASAASAQAVVVTHYPIGTLYTDSEVNLSTDSEVTFDFSAGKITPRLTGTLKTEGDRCYRVHLTSYAGATLLHDKAGTSHCFNTAVHHERSIDLSEAPDGRTDRVVVALEKQNNKTKDWTVRQSTTAGMLPYLDSVRILGSGIDIGGFDFDLATSNPTGFSQIKWTIVDGKATGTYNGTLHLDGLFNACGRVELRYRDEAGKPVSTVDGAATNCAVDNGHYAYTETLAAAASARISQVEVAMQTSGDHGVTWNDVGTPQTVSIGDV
jgi:hypothetical protein